MSDTSALTQADDAAAADPSAAERGRAGREIEAAEAEVGECETQSDTVSAGQERVAQSFRRHGLPLRMAAVDLFGAASFDTTGRRLSGSGWNAPAHPTLSGPDDVPPLE